MDKPTYLGFAVLELVELLIYETYYDKFQPCFGNKIMQVHYMDTDSFIITVSTNDNIKELRKRNDFFDFINLDKNYELFKFKRREVLEILK